MATAMLPSDPYIGEIRIFCGNPGDIPDGWAPCDGRLINIQDNEPLFAAIGFAYGGDNLTQFALPDLQGRVPINQGAGFSPGNNGGEEAVMLAENELPAHTHTVYSNLEGGNQSPAGNFWGYSIGTPYAAAPGDLTLNGNAVTTYGLGGAHENRIPFLVINYMIALTGKFPS